MFAATNLSRLPSPLNSISSEISFLKQDVHDLHDKLASVQSKLDNLCSVFVPSTVQFSTSAGSSNRIGDSNSESVAPLTFTACGQGENITTSPRVADPTVDSIMKAPINSSGFVVDPGLMPSVPVSRAGMSPGIVKIIANWYSKLHAAVRCNTATSASFAVDSGMRETRQCFVTVNF
jgi:hypothetical protein